MTNTQQQFTPEDVLSYFGGLEMLVATLGLADATPAMQMKVVDKFMRLVFKRLLLRIPKENGRLLVQVIDGEDGDELLALLKENIPDFEERFKEEVVSAIAEFNS